MFVPNYCVLLCIIMLLSDVCVCLQIGSVHVFFMHATDGAM